MSHTGFFSLLPNWWKLASLPTHPPWRKLWNLEL
jgi:hypothetical protein